jgi:hypothetical protein
MSWSVGDRVEVRADKALAWRAGTVRHAPSEGHPACPKGCYAVELDTPVTGDDWTGVTRKYGGSELVGSATNPAFIYQHTDKVAEGDHIRSE